MNYLKFSTKSQTIHMFILLIPNVDINKLIKRSLNANKDYRFCYATQTLENDVLWQKCSTLILRGRSLSQYLH